MMPRRHTLRSMPVFDRVRMASETSAVVRFVLLGAVAIAVTLGGVFAGALVVAPAVAKATHPDASAQLAQSLANTSETIAAAYASGLDLARTGIDKLPAPVTRFAVPAIAILGIVVTLSAVLLRRRTPHRSLVPAATSFDPSPRTVDRLTPRSTAKIATRDSRTPREVESLAASGASTTDIAWRTGLPIDAVQLLLALANAPRQLQPPTA